MWYYGGRIRIEPDWNVKVSTKLPDIVCCLIRIEPDWNVKSLEMDCIELLACIRIEPDWNVKAALSNKPSAHPN